MHFFVFKMSVSALRWTPTAESSFHRHRRVSLPVLVAPLAVAHAAATILRPREAVLGVFHSLSLCPALQKQTRMSQTVKFVPNVLNVCFSH